MNVLISDYHCIDLDALTLPAEEVVIDGCVLWHVWCKHCGCYHHHGPAEGHRIAHCDSMDR